MVKAAVDKVRATLEGTLGDGLVALYRYRDAETPYLGPGESGNKLLAVVAVAPDLHRLREVFVPIWEDAGNSLHSSLLIARRTAFSRHLRLFPLFADYLNQHGEILAGQNLCGAETGEADATELIAALAYRTMRASRALLPNLISPEQEEADRAQLYNVARRLVGAHLPEQMPTAVLFGKIQGRLHDLLESMPDQDPPPTDWTVDSPGKPPILATYDEIDRMVAVLPDLGARLWLQTDWQRLEPHLQAHHAWVQVTTARQLRLVMRTEATLEFVLGRFEHRWGDDPLANLEVSLRTVWRNAARLPSRLSIDDVPGAYLAAKDPEAVHKVVHDYQNRLLNMRLQHELLHRLYGVEPAAPPEPLPGQEQPLHLRVEAIVDHLEWWADYYHGQMQKSDMAEKISAP